MKTERNVVKLVFPLFFEIIFICNLFLFLLIQCTCEFPVS